MNKKLYDILMSISIGGLVLSGLILIALAIFGDENGGCLYLGLGALALATLFFVGRKTWTKE